MLKEERVLAQSKRTAPPISKFKNEVSNWYLTIQYLKEDFPIG
jgi:hypothetical protein